MTTKYHAKLFAHELSRKHSISDAEKLAGALLDAQVDLNPHQVEAALFAFKSPLSKGAILADEVGLGKTIEAGLVLAQKWTEGRRRILIITPANLRKQWTQEVAEKFFLPTLILEAHNYNKMVKDGVRQPFEQKATVICSYQFDYTSWPQTALAIENFVGKEGALIAHKVSIRGADDQDHIILAAIADDGEQLDQKTIARLFELPACVDETIDFARSETIRQKIEKDRKAVLDELAARQPTWFDDEMEKLDDWAEDKRAGLKADLKELDERIKALKKEIRQTGNLPDKLVLQKQSRSLETKRDEAWRTYDAAAKDIEVQKDSFLDQIEERLGQSISDEELFAIRFKIV